MADHFAAEKGAAKQISPYFTLSGNGFRGKDKPGK